jgi:putative selenate reductase molybdopterin-binding subunit
MLYNELGAVTNPMLRNYRIPAYADAPVTEVFRQHLRQSRTAWSKFGRRITINPVAPAIGNALKAATGVRFTSVPFSEDRIFARLQDLELTGSV